jgi:hypothetical protein
MHTLAHNHAHKCSAHIRTCRCIRTLVHTHTPALLRLCCMFGAHTHTYTHTPALLMLCRMLGAHTHTHTHTCAAEVVLHFRCAHAHIHTRTHTPALLRLCRMLGVHTKQILDMMRDSRPLKPPECVCVCEILSAYISIAWWSWLTMPCWASKTACACAYISIEWRL